MDSEPTYTAFAGRHRIVTGSLQDMLLATKQRIDRGEDEEILIFEDQTGRQVDFDFHGTAEEVVERAMPAKAPAGRGRPKLGVVSREVSLLPRHWEWLEAQPSGASAALRRLVDEARKKAPNKERARRAREAASKVMWSLCGNLPDFEEASRALFARDTQRLASLIKRWPKELREHILSMVAVADKYESEPESPE